MPSILRHSIRYGGFGIGLPLAGWVLSFWLADPPPWIVTSAAVIALALLAWSAYWGIRDLYRWWTDQREEEPAPPLFVSTWRIEKVDRVPFRRLISLRRAAQIAYPRIRHRAELRVLEKMDKDRNDLPGTVAQFLLNQATFPITLYGTMPPMNVFEKIPAKDAKEFSIAGDARALIDQYNDTRRYINVAIKRSDLKRRIKELQSRA